MMKIVFSLFPVLFFLLFLFLFDSFKLVVKKNLALCIAWGMISAGIAYVINSMLFQKFNLDFKFVSHYISPFSEELLKCIFILFLLQKKRIGFMIDAAIYGFAIGAGFALVENIVYMYNLNSPDLLTWIIRGFGTAIMHGGCSSLIAIILAGARNREVSNFIFFILALLTACVIHSLFNHFYISPILQTLGIVVLFPVIFTLVFRLNEKQLQNWLEIEFSSEVELLTMIKKGKFRHTKSGQFLSALKDRFAPEVLVDMYCYISLYLELSIKAKRNMMLRENGFSSIIEDDIAEKLKELSQLRKQIGKIGELTLSPLIRMNYRDLWKLNSLT